ncbi:MAG TPA: hypothetical protein PK099_11050 [Saprospiraceae bacterium]|nr:hypothetical protein [Saprospiraceae bacterium]HNC36489.1 hypothetical protein [Saprospiraceae bacterium]HNI79779.1 hypothetical protein [Saprospiraceae bacterium]HNL19818.1 hypothetical protein [Saprospiraceae bacterium]
MNRIILVFSMLWATLQFSQLNAQCTPASADNCEDANVLCSLDEVNGYTCQNPDYSNPTGCTPLCPSGGGAHNTSWWAFVTNGGNVCITVTFSNCTVNGTGVQFGIWGDCDCGESIFCDPSCTGPGTKTACGVLEPCKTYYLFVDGCTGDVCDFTLTTSGGGPPMLPPLGNLTGPTKLCKGACNVMHMIDLGSSTCKPAYQWTLDGVELDQYGNKVTNDFPDEGDFVLCVTAIIGNPQSGSICDQEGPKCITIQVRQEKDRKDGPRIVCFENAPITWQGQQVSSSGEYTQHFTDKNCCEYDSLVTFFVTEKPDPPDLYFLGCPGDVYIDPTTKVQVANCQDPKEIFLAKSTSPYKCDSSYNLHAAFLNGGGRFREYCQGGMVLLEVQPIDRTCPVNGYFTESFEYKWYKKNDPAKTSLGTDEFIEVGCSKEEYCVDVVLVGKLDKLTKKCPFTVCEQFNESDFCYPKICPKGDLQLCVGRIGTYSVDTIFPADARHIWTVSGGLILTQNPIGSKSIDVLWNFDPKPNKEYDGIVCYQLQSSCPETPECCITVKIKVAPQPSAGPDIKICGLSNTLRGKFDVGGGTWKQILGPGNATITPNNIENPVVDAPAYGRYGFVITENSLGCVTEDTVYADFNSSPEKGPTTYICGGSNKDYVYSFQIMNGTAPYKILKGNGKVDANNIYTSGIVLNNVSDTVLIEDINGCQLLYIQDHECKCTNDIGVISNVPIEKCADASITIIYDNTNEKLDASPRDTVIYFFYTNPANPWGSRVALLNSKTFTKQNWMQFGVTYYVGVRLGRADGKGGIDPILGCLRESVGTPFTFYEIPSPFAGRDTAVCGTTFDLQGFQSITGSQFRWTEKNGKSVIFSNSSDPTSTVDVLDGYGTYVFVCEEDNQNGLCVTTDQVNITFHPNPTVEDVDKVCLNLLGGVFNIDERYLVKANLKTGTPPYVLVIPPSTANGKIVGNTYCSDTLASLEDFIVLIRDANGCESSLLQDNYNCNCGPIYAGELDSLTTTVCQDKCVPIKSILKEIIDPEDIAMYVVHKSSYTSKTDVIDTLYSINDVICFDPTKMKLGAANPVYVTRVVGDDVAPKDGVVDPKDPCKRASNNMKIVFEPYATPLAGADIQVCGLNYKLDGQLSFGNASWRKLTGPGNVTFADPTDPTSGLSVSVKGVYTFELQGDNFSCIGLDTVQVTFVDAPEFIDNTITYECDNVAENYRIKITSQLGDRPSWNLTGRYAGSSTPLTGAFLAGTDTWESGWIPTGEDFDLAIKDANDCSTDLFTGSHICACITDAGNMDLTPINLCSDGKAQAKYTVAPGVMDANDIIRYVLYDGQSNNPRGGTIITFNDNGGFVFDPGTMMLGKTYYIAVFVGNLDPKTGNVNFTDRCLDNTPGVPVTWFMYPVAKIDGPNELSCKVTSLVLNGGNSISGSGDALQYTWSNNDKTPTTTVTTPGTYTLNVVDPRANCPNSTSFVVTIDTARPQVQLDNPLELTCDRTQVNIDGNKSDKGAIYVPTWTGPGLVAGASSYLATANAIGQYILTVENTKNGCKESKGITVTEDKSPPVADVKQIGDLTCTVNQITLDGSGSRGTSGTIGTYTWVGNVISGQGTSKITIGKPGGTYELTVKDSKNGCLSKDTIVVNEIGNPLADIVANAENPKCFGDRNGQIIINDVLDKNGNVLTNLQYSINGGPYSSNRVYNNLPQGSYTISVKDANGCLISEKEVLVEPSKLGIEVIRTIVVDQGTIVDLDSLLLRLYGGTANATGAYKDTLWFNIDQQIDWKSRKIYAADTTREFLITGIDQSGCQIQDRVRVLVRIIKEVWWPTVINPGSGVVDNKFFNLYGKRVRNIKTLQIFDRWGEMVYSGENLLDGNKAKGIGWNGEFRGDKALPGVYAFYAEVQYEGSPSSDKFKGEFTLVR